MQMKKELSAKQITTILSICCLIIIGCILCAAFIYADNNQKKKFVYEDHLEDTVVTIDGADITLREVTYYVIKMEAFVDAAAHEYNPSRPQAYWNMYINNTFLRSQAKKSTMNLFIRDYIYYLEAVELGLTLSDEQINTIHDEIYTTFKNMSASQMNLTGYTETELYNILYRVEMAKAYTTHICTLNEELVEEDFNPDGSHFNEIYEKHSISVNNDIWDGVKMGFISINND